MAGGVFLFNNRRFNQGNVFFDAVNFQLQLADSNIVVRFSSDVMRCSLRSISVSDESWRATQYTIPATNAIKNQLSRRISMIPIKFCSFFMLHLLPPFNVLFNLMNQGALRL